MTKENTIKPVSDELKKISEDFELTEAETQNLAELKNIHEKHLEVLAELDA